MSEKDFIELYGVTDLTTATATHTHTHPGASTAVSGAVSGAVGVANKRRSHSGKQRRGSESNVDSKIEMEMSQELAQWKHLYEYEYDCDSERGSVGSGSVTNELKKTNKKRRIRRNSAPPAVMIKSIKCKYVDRSCSSDSVHNPLQDSD
jgi:hypothetical protein